MTCGTCARATPSHRPERIICTAPREENGKKPVWARRADKLAEWAKRPDVVEERFDILHRGDGERCELWRQA